MKMKKLVFHIGRPKTASTFLQKRINSALGCEYIGVNYTRDKHNFEVKKRDENYKKIFKYLEEIYTVVLEILLKTCIQKLAILLKKS